ncbi:helix-turn-helix domain-containing protein [Lewinella sp. IMCC34191]|uniref:helix-turn-helix domain-containing protein n=1 Tax=Lewinella sp. IMCC34191 TaxID=2259172 RepID=UPI000E237076|nr:AraC family transcriptional regulator [Lewinella sp. IMCC34191]
MTSLIVQSILIFLLVGLALLLAVLPHNRFRQNLPLSIALLLMALHTLTDLTVDRPLLGSLRWHLASAPLIFLYGPLLYLYCRRHLRVQVGLSRAHLAPLVAAIIAYLVFGFSHLPYFGCFLLQYAYYARAVHRLTGEKHLSATGRGWLRFITYSFGGVWLAAVGATLLSNVGLEFAATRIEQLAFSLGVAFFAGVVYFVVARPGLFMNVQVAIPNRTRSAHELDPASIARMEQLDRLLDESDGLLETALDRETLAARLGTDPQQLSAEVNTYFSVSLPELINQRRVAAAETLLQTTDRTVKEIYYAVGFNSRSVFNTNFKRVTGYTPSAYRNRHK